MYIFIQSILYRTIFSMLDSATDLKLFVMSKLITFFSGYFLQKNALH